MQIGGKSYKREQWQDTCGSIVLDAWTQLGGPHGTDANLNATYTIPFFGLDQAGDVDPQVAQCAGAGGSGGGGGTTSTGGSGTSAGASAGGQANPGGGTDATSGGNPSTAGGANVAGNGGTGTNPNPGTGGSGGSGTSVAGTSDGTMTDVPDSDTPARPGCACHVAGRSSTGDALAWAGALALGVVFSRRRRAAC